MNVEQASKLIMYPYMTEKTLGLVEKENKLIFIVHDDADKRSIKEAMKVLYEIDVYKVNTARTIYGKKAFVKLKEDGAARDLATKLGLV
ncbi:MAG: 50S ribosomal protein L23 [Nitrososphaerales archaeon]